MDILARALLKQAVMGKPLKSSPSPSTSSSSSSSSSLSTSSSSSSSPLSSSSTSSLSSSSASASSSSHHHQHDIVSIIIGNAWLMFDMCLVSKLAESCFFQVIGFNLAVQLHSFTTDWSIQICQSNVLCSNIADRFRINDANSSS